ncbi:ExbD/TolR family protein [Planctomicrobium sp. SH664]|uniref:ExbD/TolR family protein n=1 Tax=Planctomicrobium sp. SH664 TaxID=3448125 RepID=UPI003F5BB6C4
MSKRRQRRLPGEVELNLAAMLDMAFQLLAFFILTFRPSPIEGEILVNLPPPVPMTNVAIDAPQGAAGEGIMVKETLPITIRDDGNGAISSVSVGQRTIFEGEATPARLALLDKELRETLSIRETPFDQVLIMVAPRIPYAELMKVIDICTRQKFSDGSPLNKISFSEYATTE